MPTTKADNYQDRRHRLKQTVEEASTPLTEMVFSIQQRTGERQSYTYINAVLNGQDGKTSAPVLNKLETELDERDLL